jgi:hypothetical protein
MPHIFQRLCAFEFQQEIEILIMGVQQPEDIFSITRTNLRARRNILCLGTNDVRRDDVSPGITLY